MSTPEQKIATALRQHGYKLTPQRRAVLKAISLNHSHLTPAELYDKVRQDYPGIGYVTIYRTLEVLAELGLICEVFTGGNSRSYLLRRPSGHHHHLICSECGAVADFTGCELGELERRLSRETGFQVESHHLEVFGRCQDCQKVSQV